MLKNRRTILNRYKKLLKEYKENPIDFSLGLTSDKIALRDDYETIGKDMLRKVNRKASKILKRKYR